MAIARQHTGSKWKQLPEMLETIHRQGPELHGGRNIRTQDYYCLIRNFVRLLREALPCDGVEYENDDLNLYYVDGSLEQASCQFNLAMNDTNLGLMRITRATRFDQQEIILIENILSGLIKPLSMALMHPKLIHSAFHDELTGLCNTRFYHDRLEMEIKRALRHARTFSIIKMDIDDFGKINEIYGKDSGDNVIQEIAQRLERFSRRNDMIFRNMDDEFVMLLTAAPNTTAVEIASRIKRSVLSTPLRLDDNDVMVTFSVGVASFRNSDDASSLLDRCDQALYQAKAEGKDRIYSDAGLRVPHQE